MLAQGRLAERLCIYAVRAKKGNEAREPARQCLRECLILAERLIFQPQPQNDKGLARPFEFAVEARHEPVAPQYRQCVIAELAPVPGFVLLPDVVKTK